MKRHIASAILVLGMALSGAPARAEEMWSEQSVEGAGPFHELFFADDLHGWAMGEEGLLYRSTDGGTEWELLMAPDMPDEMDIFFIDARTGWIAGSEGRIIRSDDGGQSWVYQVSGVEDDLMDIFFVDAQTGWAVGEDGLVLGTVDGGSNWALQEVDGPEEKVELTGIFCTGATRGWIVGQAGHILETRDGQRWQAVDFARIYIDPVLLEEGEEGEEGEEAAGDQRGSDSRSSNAVGEGQGDGEAAGDLNLRALFFLDARTGWAAGSNGAIFRTADGENWELMHAETGLNLSSVSFVDAQNGWAVGRLKQDGLLLRTEDGGATWTRQLLQTEGKAQFVFFVNERTGWVASEFETVFRTDDGGEEWTTLHSGFSRANMFNEVFFIDEEYGWVAGTGGQILKTRDGGKNWSDVSSATEQDMNDLIFFDRNRGLAVGDLGRILLTEDGGREWRVIASGADADLRSICFADAGNGWIAGMEGHVLHTEDGGRTWSRMSFADTLDFVQVFFADARNGWILGGREGMGEDAEHVDEEELEEGEEPEGSLLLRTDDGGATWTESVTGVKGLISVFFVDAQRGWGVTNDGSIVHTANGGNDWEVQKSLGISLHTLCFTDGEFGWAGGRDVLLRTTDGGATWSYASSPTIAQIEGISSVGDRVVWFVGNEGFILKYEAYEGITAVEDVATGLPGGFALAQNFPNPFNAETVISYNLPVSGQVELVLYNITGQRVAVLVEGVRAAGHHSVRLAGDDLSTGVYLYQLSIPGYREVRRMLLLK